MKRWIFPVELINQELTLNPKRLADMSAPSYFVNLNFSARKKFKDDWTVFASPYMHDVYENLTNKNGLVWLNLSGTGELERQKKCATTTIVVAAATRTTSEFKASYSQAGKI